MDEQAGGQRAGKVEKETQAKRQAGLEGQAEFPVGPGLKDQGRTQPTPHFLNPQMLVFLMLLLLSRSRSLSFAGAVGQKGSLSLSLSLPGFGIRVGRLALSPSLPLSLSVSLSLSLSLSLMQRIRSKVCWFEKAGLLGGCAELHEFVDPSASKISALRGCLGLLSASKHCKL